MNKLSSIIYRLRNILFILFMIGLIRLIPNIKELDFIGKESIEEAISYVIEFFKIDISLEDALRKKEW